MYITSTPLDLVWMVGEGRDKGTDCKGQRIVGDES